MKTAWNGFSSMLADDIEKYLQYKRATKRKFRTEESVLRLLDVFLIGQDVGDLDDVTPVVIEGFLASRPRSRPRSYNHLLGVIRCFFEWMIVQERLKRSPVRVRPKPTTAQRQPFLFDPDQAKRLLDLAACLPDRPKGPNRGATYYLVFALMYALGLRVGEVSRLCHKDVDLPRQLLVIRETKFSKDRLVPFGPRVGHRLAEYLTDKKSHGGILGPVDPVFSFNAGRPINPGTISQTFHRLVTQHPFPAPAGVEGPRLHCLRHSFAVSTLLRWYRSGIDPSLRLIHLSTFLGHVNPMSTAWYITITTELLDAANERFERYVTLPDGVL